MVQKKIIYSSRKRYIPGSIYLKCTLPVHDLLITPNFQRLTVTCRSEICGVGFRKSTAISSWTTEVKLSIHIHRHKSLENSDSWKKSRKKKEFSRRQMIPTEIERRGLPKSPIFAFQSIKAYIFLLPKPDHKPSIEKTPRIFSPSDGKKVTVWLSGSSGAIHLRKTNEDVGRNDLELGSFINDNRLTWRMVCWKTTGRILLWKKNRNHAEPFT